MLRVNKVYQDIIYTATKIRSKTLHVRL